MKNLWQIASAFFLITFVQSKVIEFPIETFEKEVKLFKGQKIHFPGVNGEQVPVELEIPDSLPRLKDMNEEITFQLFTNETGDEYQILKVNDIDGLTKSYFNPKRPTRFFSHGWQTNADNSNSKSYSLLKAFLRNGDCNLISINWISMSSGPYTIIRLYMEKMGQHVASFIDFLETQGMNLNDTTLIGFSLGAHVAGVAGYFTKNKVTQVIGLDPAWPLYAFSGPNNRISTESGNNVEIIHTDAGLLGHPSVLGHFDFYPNGGGPKQPGCGLDLTGGCSHSRVVEYYLESLESPNGFYGMECNSYLHFKSGKCNEHIEIMGGIDLTHKKQGVYYLKTNAEKPYAKGEISKKKTKYLFNRNVHKDIIQ